MQTCTTSISCLVFAAWGGAVSYTTGLKGKSTISMYCDCVSEGLREEDTHSLDDFRPTFSLIFFCILSLCSIFSSHISIHKCPFRLSWCFPSNSLSVSLPNFLILDVFLLILSLFALILLLLYFSSIVVYPNKNLSGNQYYNVVTLRFLSEQLQWTQVKTACFPFPLHD